ncbi:MAG: HAD family phosphatase [Alicyclobacillaceae bacterium]|nr:HAD family phosphatase [Alicyclobacillaceae bacterium]
MTGHWRLIALDMDGTLLRPDETISDENRRWIQRAREAGLEVTLATGRMMRGLVPALVQELGLTAPVVTGNGGEVWMPDGSLVERHVMAADDVRWLLALAREHRVHHWGSAAEALFRAGTFPEQVEAYTWVKFGFESDDPVRLRVIWDQLQAAGRFELTNSHPSNIEVNPAGVNKATGLATVCRILGIRAAEVIAMGDGLNDVPMLRWAGLGIAMGNAQPWVKEAADEVTEHHLADGVAKAIERILGAGALS